MKGATSGGSGAIPTGQGGGGGSSAGVGGGGTSSPGVGNLQNHSQKLIIGMTHGM